uniref:Uncharacterized protein n=1 Tax=Erpetoichthys calabaricus TaxID=27687 RepID=A0A8C4SYA7_ERPCA
MSFKSGSGNFSFDISTKSGLTALYNTPVYEADRVQRAMGGMPEIGPLSHTGVRVTLKDGSQWLIHKGPRFGKSSETVVVDAKHMSSDWKVIETKDFQGSKKVADFVEAGGSNYNIIFDNCHLGSRRMMDQK